MAIDYEPTLKKYINVVMHEGASDLHLRKGTHPTIRVNKGLSPMLKEPILSGDDTRGFAKALLTEQQFNRLETEQQIDFAYEIPEGTRFRGNAFYTRGYLSIVLRVIPRTIRTVAELNLPDILLSFAHKSGILPGGRSRGSR